MEFFVILIKFVFELFFKFMAIEITEGVSFGLLLASFLLIYLFIKFLIGIGGGNKND